MEIEGATPRSLRTVTVGEVMSHPVRTVTPETNLEEVTRLLVEEGISGLPVVDRDQRLVGIVSKTDLLWYEYEVMEEAEDEDDVRRRVGMFASPHRVTRPRSTIQVRELLRAPPTLTIGDTASLLDAAALMACRGVHRLPVVDANGALVGILSALDVLTWIAHDAGRVVQRRPGKAR